MMTRSQRSLADQRSQPRRTATMDDGRDPERDDVRFYLDELIKHVDGSGNSDVACHYEPLRALREAVIREQYDKFMQVKLDRFIQPKH